MRCSVLGCKSDNQSQSFVKTVMFFRFPTDEKLIQAWKGACNRSDFINDKTARICSKHFKASDYKRNLRHELLGYTARNLRLIKNEAVPTQNLPGSVKLSPLESSYIAQRDRELERRENSKIVDEILRNKCGKLVNLHKLNKVGDNGDEGQVGDICMASEDQIPCAKDRDFGVNTDVDEKDQVIAELQNKIKLLEMENQAFRKLFSSSRIIKLTVRT